MNLINKLTSTELKSCDNADTFLQSAMWGEFKSRFGWTAKSFLIEWEGQGSTLLLVLCHRLAPGFSFAYIPWGPELPKDFQRENRAEALVELAERLKPYVARNTVFVRFDLPWQEIPSVFSAYSVVNKNLKQGTAVQAPDTVIIDLNQSCEEILKAMKPKWRYNINLAEKKGVLVETNGEEKLDDFYQLMKETAARDGISIHSIDYYKTLFEICEKPQSDSKVRLYTAAHEGDTLAAIMVLLRGKEAVYLYGASSNEKRNLMAPYALQWKAMQDAKDAGCQFYDLFGIPPNEDPKHPMAGLYRFKTGFGSTIVHRPGCWDYRYKKAAYGLFTIAESLRKRLLNRNKRKV